MEAIKGIKDPQAAFEIMKASAEAGAAMFAKNLKDATALSFGQFHSTVDAIEKPILHLRLVAVAKNLKAAASTAESAIDTAMEKSASMAASVAPASKAKKTR